MVAAAAILVVLVLVVSVGIVLFLHSWGAEEARTEARLHDPRTHTIAYAVPNGVDPVVIRLALTHAGFTSAIDRVGDDECLRVECENTDRTRVRSAIEGIHVSEYDGSELTFGHVVFEDER
jgi:hypothetical protein